MLKKLKGFTLVELVVVMAVVVILAAATLMSNAYNEKETVNNEAVRWQTLIETARNDAIAQREPRIVTINLYPKQVTENYAPQQGTEGKTLAAYTLPAKVTFIAGTAPLRICYDAFGTLEIPNAQGGFTPLDVNTPSIAFYLTNKTATVTEKVTIYRNSGTVAVSYGAGPAPGEGTFTLTYTAGSGGTLAGNRTQTVKAGERGTPVTAVPNTGYAFVNWSDGVATATRTDTNVTANKTVTANFAIISYTVIFVNGYGTTLSTQVIASGGNASVPSNPMYTGKTFAGWAGTYTNVTSTRTITAAWNIIYFTIQSGYGPGAYMQTDHVPYGGSVTIPFTAASDRIVYLTGEVVDGTWVLGPYYNGTSPVHSNWNVKQYELFVNYTFSNVTANHTLKFYSEQLLNDGVWYEQLTLTYIAGANGKISGTTPQYVAGIGANGTAVTAVPNTGYSFANWSDGVATATRTDTNVTADKTVTANFTIISYTVTFVDYNGKVLSTQAIAYGGNARAPGNPTGAGYPLTFPYSQRIGTSYGGGKIAYVYVLFAGWSGPYTGVTSTRTITATYAQKGLIAATTDQSTGIEGIPWATSAYCGADVINHSYWGTLVPGGTSQAIGAGAANTAKIIAQNGAGTSYAAGLAHAYTGGGYTDWYLPSEYEMNQLYINRAALGIAAVLRSGSGNYAGDGALRGDYFSYWCSSEYGSAQLGGTYATGVFWNVYGWTGGTNTSCGNPKASGLFVRAVRSF